MNQSLLNPAKLGVLDTIAVNGAEHSSQALSKWFGRHVQITSGGFRSVPLEELSSVICPAEEVIVAVHTHMVGSLDGHVLLAFPENVAFQLVDILMQQPQGTTTQLTEMEQSAIQETGNIVSSAYINSLCMSLGVRALPSAPNFLYDIAGAIIQPMVLEQAAMSNFALMIAATFKIDDSAIDWWLFVLPNPQCLEVMEALLT